MAKDFSKGFYNSTAWNQCRVSYCKKMRYLCERCGGLGTEVHHIIHLTPENISDPEITLNFKNLMCLCHQCHMREHKQGSDTRYFIDADGHVVPKNFSEKK